jgi:hypothetical protein
MVKYRVNFDEEFFEELKELSNELRYTSLQSLIRAKMKEILITEKTKILQLKSLANGEKKENNT